MTNQFPDLVTDYEVDWAPAPPEGYLPEDGRHDHGYVHLANGYTVSILRSNADPRHVTLGFEDGKWEAVVGRPVEKGSLAELLGMMYDPATELDHLVEEKTHGVAVAGPFDSAGVTEFIALVAEQPKAQVSA